MSAGTCTRFRVDSHHIILRYSHSAFAPALEFPVELVAENDKESILRVPIELGESTAVTLLAENYMVNGIVRFCRADTDAFLITVAKRVITDRQYETAFFHDPGPLGVDDFLTEEEEARILESLQ
jgi:hypothetical protein